MKRFLFNAMVLAMLTPAAAIAQDARISVGAGGMLPTEAYHPGWQLMGAFEVTFPLTAVGLRVDGMYGQIRHQYIDAFEVITPTALNGGIANLVYYVGSPTVPRRLYLLAGVGYYFINGSDLSPAFGGGTGLSVGAGPMKLVVEGRFIRIRSSGSTFNFFPVTGGVSIGL